MKEKIIKKMLMKNKLQIIYFHQLFSFIILFFPPLEISSILMTGKRSYKRCQAPGSDDLRLGKKWDLGAEEELCARSKHFFRETAR
jgi:hypothetical protein